MFFEISLIYPQLASVPINKLLLLKDLSVNSWTFVISDGSVTLIKIIPHRNYGVEKIITRPEAALKKRQLLLVKVLLNSQSLFMEAKNTEY